MKERVYLRGKSYTFVIDAGHDEMGRRRRISRGGFATEREAHAEARKLLVKVDEDGSYVAPSKQTVKAFMERWLDSLETTVHPNTRRFYANLIRANVIPHIGDVQLRRLTVPHLNHLYATLRESGRRDGKGLAPSTVVKVHTTIGTALAAAVAWGELPRNVASLASPPRDVGAAKMRTWTGPQVAQFLESVKGDRLEALYVLLALTGLRRGEALGLRWCDVDFDAGRLAVVQTVVSVDYAIQFSGPKTKAGRRSVALDKTTIAALRDHRRRQLEERSALGVPWPGQDDLVFSGLAGEPIHPGGFSDRFTRLVKRAKLPAIRVHDLRHTHATLALTAGVPAKVVQERLGHSSVALTLDIYSHVIPSMEEAAAERVAALVFGAG